MKLVHTSIGQVLEEDEDFMTIKVAKSDTVEFALEGGERFVTLAFTKADEHGNQMLPWGGS